MWAEAVAGAKVCVSVQVRALCWRLCVGAEKSRELRLKEGEELLSGKAERWKAIW